jgi:enamine deaminase RidA (YjgF/YER057c/UK114 family)
MAIDERLAQLGVTLPAAPRPVGSYVPAKQAGDLVFVSGVLPFKDGKVQKPGKLGGVLTVADGADAARLALLNALAIVQQEVGSLDRVKSIVRMVGHVASAEGFVNQPAVLNGASDLLVEIFGEAGRHARLALGAAELPLHAAVELELIVQIHSV